MTNPIGNSDSTITEPQPDAHPLLAIESIPVSMIIIEKSGIIRQVNRETEQLFGYSRDELLGSFIEILIPEPFRGGHASFRDKFFQHPEIRRMGSGQDLFGVKKDGSLLPVEIGLNPVHTGSELLVIAAIIDQSSQKLEEDRFRSAVESAPMAMVMTDVNGRIALVNAETERLFGYAKMELIDQQLEILLPERFRKAHLDQRAGYFHTPLSRRMGEGRDLYALRKDGSEFPVEVGLNPVETAEGLFVLSAITDITERKKMEAYKQQVTEELAQKNKQLQYANQALDDKSRLLESLVECIGAGLLAVDKDGDFTVVNKAARRLLGIAHNAGNLRDINCPVYHKDQKTPVATSESPLQKALLGHHIADLELYVDNPHHAGGTPVHVTARPSYGKNKEITGAIATFKNVEGRT